MLFEIASAGSSLAKRAASEAPGNMAYNIWPLLIIASNIIIFLPAIVFFGYTLTHIYPTLAMIEDPNPPAYEPVSLGTDNESFVGNETGPHPGSPVKLPAAHNSPYLITTSLRRTHHLLRSLGGWSACLRGIGCASVLAVAGGFASGFFAALPFVPYFFGSLLASLALVQVRTVWVHVVISPPSRLSWWQRLPPLRRTFEATCFPVLTLWATECVRIAIPLGVASLVGLPIWDSSDSSSVPAYDASATWKTILVGLAGLVCSLLLVVPAHAVLVRVQASLLPVDEDTIVSFDRSYGGSVEPAIVGGKGYVSMLEAWRTVDRASWLRLYFLYAKVYALGIAIYLALCLVVMLEFALLSTFK